jgi:hypothetical protein
MHTNFCRATPKLRDYFRELTADKLILIWIENNHTAKILTRLKRTMRKEQAFVINAMNS